MRKISANYIFPVSSAPIKNGIIIVDDNGIILEIINNNGEIKESAGLEFYNGIIVPGFINTHSHLELSYLKNRINKGLGLKDFVSELVIKRNNINDNEKRKAAFIADKLMYKDGIVAIGDISNTADTIAVKISSKIYYKSFIEIYGSDKKIAKKSFDYGIKIKNKFIANNLYASLSPHSPYSVSKDLFLLLESYYKDNNDIISIHNQETQDENTMFRDGSGLIFQMIKNMGADMKSWEPTGENSINYYLKYLPKTNNKILVHNTFTKKADINFANFNSNNIFWCLCPNANLFIEKMLPDIYMLNNNCKNITIGTDSFASNDKLSVLSEIITITNNFPDISFNTIIKWATSNGANALDINDKYGSLEIGKKPGLVLIENFDFTNNTVSNNSTCKRLI